MPRVQQQRASGGTRIVMVAVIIVAVAAGFRDNGLPSVRPATAPDTAFSAARAVRDLQVISATPHATGTAAHDRLRDYLVDRLRQLDCENVHIQSATGFNTLDGPIAATVANVVCSKPGLHGAPAILLTAHYDAVPWSFGAADDGEGVAAILETLRALDARSPLDRDVIVLFSDAEEDGLLGAEAFVDLHPWAKDVGIVLNFDARGDQGPVFMFQTSSGNAALIDALAAVPDARANSLTGEVYRHLPSDTDMSIWLHSAFDVGAMNFANVGGYTHYHTPLDNLASLDLRVVQQMGDYAVGLTTRAGHGQLPKFRTHDDVYFNAPLVGVLRYPVSWAIPLALISALLAMAATVRAMRHADSLERGLGRANVVALITCCVPALVAAAFWKLITAMHPAYADILQHDPYNSLDYLLVVIALAVGVAAAAMSRTEDVAPRFVALPGLLLWAAIGVAVAVLSPGASYLFAWPVIALALAVLLAQSTASRPIVVMLLAAAAVPALVLWPPLIVSLETGLTASVLPLCAVLLSLLLVVLMPQLQLLGRWNRGLAALAVAVAVVALVVAERHSAFTAERRDPDSLDYVINADDNTARWISADRAPDAWTRTVLGNSTMRHTFPAFAFTYGRSMLASAPEVPSVTVDSAPRLSTTPMPHGTRVQLHVARTGSGEIIHVTGRAGMRLSAVTINGRALAASDGDRYHAGYSPDSAGDVLTYFGVPPEGVDLQFDVAGSTPIALRVETAVEGLPAVMGPRPPMLMSKPFIATDMTITERIVRP